MVRPPHGATMGAMDVLVAGGGLCGTLMALALSQRQLAVTLLTGSAHPTPIPAATGYSYGGIPWWMGVGTGGRVLSGQGLACWRRLQQRHGDLGLRPAALLLHWSAADDSAAVEAAVETLTASLPEGTTPERWGRPPFCRGALQALGLTCAGAIQLPYGRIDNHRYRQAMGRVLHAQGVRCLPGAVDRLLVRHGQCIGVRLTDGAVLESDGVVLATGAATASLLPLSKAYQWFPYSWASVLPLRQPRPCPEVILLPLLGRRERVERQGGAALVVDPGLAPWGWGHGVGSGHQFSTPGQAFLFSGPPRRDAAPGTLATVGGGGPSSPRLGWVVSNAGGSGPAATGGSAPLPRQLQPRRAALGGSLPWSSEPLAVRGLSGGLCLGAGAGAPAGRRRCPQRHAGPEAGGGSGAPPEPLSLEEGLENTPDPNPRLSKR